MIDEEANKLTNVRCLLYKVSTSRPRSSSALLSDNETYTPGMKPDTEADNGLCVREVKQSVGLFYPEGGRKGYPPLCEIAVGQDSFRVKREKYLSLDEWHGYWC